MKTASFALALCLGLTGAAAAETPADDAAAPRNNVCFSPSHIKNTTPISDREILFYMSDGKIWKNTLRADCPGLKFEGGFSWVIRGDTVCSNTQVIHVLRRGTPCFLGDFSAYTPPAKPQTDQSE